MLIRYASLTVIAAGLLTVGCSNSNLRSTLAPSSVADFPGAGTATSGTTAIAPDADVDHGVVIDTGTEDDGAVAPGASTGTGEGPMIARAACTPTITPPSRITGRFTVKLTPCASTWTLEADYLTRNGNWWPTSILMNQNGTMWSRVNQTAGTTVTVDVSKLPAASSATQFRLTLTAAGRTAYFRFTYKR